MALHIYRGVVMGSPANLAFLFGFDEAVTRQKLPDKKFIYAGGGRQMWRLRWNKAMGGDEMELVPGLLGVDRLIWEGWSRRNGIRTGNRETEGKKPLLSWGQPGL